MDVFRFAVLGYERRLSFRDGGHRAYWDGWYESRERAEASARAKRERETADMTYIVVERPGNEK